MKSSFFNCSSDKLSEIEGKKLDGRIETYFKDKPYALLSNFLESRPRGSGGGHTFEIKDFTDFLDFLESNQSCKGAISAYSHENKEISKKWVELMERRKSNEQILVRSCKIQSTKSTDTKATAKP